MLCCVPGQPSAVFSDIDLSSFQGARSEANSPPTSRNAVLLDRERTINALRHRLEEKDNIILTLQAEQDTLKAENKSLQGRMQSQVSELHWPLKEKFRKDFHPTTTFRFDLRRMNSETSHSF